MTRSTDKPPPSDKHFMIHLPGTVYGVDEYAPDKSTALRQFRNRNNLSRMPKGSACWEK